MGENNGPALLDEDKQETATDKTSKFYFKTQTTMFLSRNTLTFSEVSAADFSELQQIRQRLSAWLGSKSCCCCLSVWFGQYRQLAHYFSLLCFLLTIIIVFLSLCLVQTTLLFQSQSTLQETKLRDLTNRLEKLNKSYHLLFSQYPALNQYCSVSNSSTGERECSPCPAGWTPLGDKCYLFSQDRADWISSQYRCMTLGGAVATVRTEDEQVFLWKKAQSLSQGDSYWLGLRSSAADAGWQWSDGSVLKEGPQFWWREPDTTADNKELCGRLTPGDDYRKSWFTSRCSNSLRSICEKRQASLLGISVSKQLKMSDLMEEKIKGYRTAPFDARFPNTNQTRNCFQNYLDFHRCNKALSAKDQDIAPCQWYQRVYKSLCPMSWVQRWDEQVEAGNFPGKI
ncbi:hypothetical protein Q8A73_000189 [Channa argus]|nr:hypothetical protein Q8A73_000189 [Channa argus]